MKKSGLLFCFVMVFLDTYSQVSTKTNEDLIKEAYKQFGVIELQMKDHEKNKPEGTKEDLQKEIDARNILIVSLSSVNPSELTDEKKSLIATYKSENETLLAKIQKNVDWEKTKNDYEFKIREVTATINLLQQSIDRKNADKETQEAIEKANIEQRNIRNKQAGRFVASVYTLRSMLDVLGGVYATGSSIIILDNETNKKTSKVLRNSGLSILSILGGLLALNSYQEKKNGEASIYFGVSVGLTALSEYLKNNKKAEYAFEASMRNVLFGDVIRKHEHVVQRMRENVNKLYNKIIPVGIEEEGWFPTEADYILFEQIITDRDELQLFLYDIRQQSELILQTNLNQSDASRKMLQQMITDANTSEERWSQDRLLFNQNLAFIKTELAQTKKK